MSLYQDVIIAGFGGQGVLFSGNLLAYAGMGAGLEVTFMPEYGPEMRGGTANCTVVLSSESIGSPIIRRPLALIALNQPSMDKFSPHVRDGGVQVLNTPLVDAGRAEPRLRTFAVPAGELAGQAGDARLANMAALGAYVRATGIMPPEAVIAALPTVISSHYRHLVPINAKAFQAGVDYVAMLEN